MGADGLDCSQWGKRRARGLKAASLTILIVLRHPSLRFDYPSFSPQLFHAIFGVLEALLDLNSLMSLDDLAENVDVASGRIESLVAAAFNVVHVFTNDLPVIKVEDLGFENLICMTETIQNEPLSWSAADV